LNRNQRQSKAQERILEKIQYTHREMYSLGEALVKDYIEKKEDRLYRGKRTRTLKEEHRIIERNRG